MYKNTCCLLQLLYAKWLTCLHFLVYNMYIFFYLRLQGGYVLAGVCLRFYLFVCLLAAALVEVFTLLSASC